MKLLRNPILIVVGLLALAIVLVAGCTKKPEAPNANIPPSTRITNYHISTSPDSAAFYNVTVYWAASDPDGQAEYYRYWMDQANIADSMKTGIYETSVAVRMEFNSNIRTHVFYVEARDDRNVWDPIPAQVQVNIDEVSNVSAYNPDTDPITVPPDGAITSRGVSFVIEGTDTDGAVMSFQWAVDDTANWHTVTPTFILSNSSTLELRLTPADVTLGPHTVFIRSVDNFGNIDESPVSVSIDARSGFAPEVSLSVRNNESFVVPFTTPTMDTMLVTITSTVDFYYGAIRNYYIYSSTGLADTTTDNVITLTNLSGGDYWVKVVANDIAGNSTVDSTNFAIVVLGAHQGILGINGIDWASYGGEAVAVWNNAVPFGDFPHFKWWDLFLIPPSGGRPYADSVLGTGSIPEWIFDTTYFAAIVWFANSYSGDDAYWTEREDVIMNYLNNGGNLILATRYGNGFFFDELNAFTGTDPVDWAIGVNPQMLTAVADSLTDISRTSSQSYTDLPKVSGSSTTVLYRDNDYPAYAAGFIAEPSGAGKFVFIAGRNYRWDGTELKANLDVIYRYYFGMRDQY